MDYLNEEKLDVELRMEHGGTGARDRWHIQIMNYSPTAQPGYQSQLMFNHSGTKTAVIDTAMEWFLQHRRKVRAARR